MGLETEGLRSCYCLAHHHFLGCLLSSSILYVSCWLEMQSSTCDISEKPLRSSEDLDDTVSVSLLLSFFLMRTDAFTLQAEFKGGMVIVIQYSMDCKGVGQTDVNCLYSLS